MKRITSFILMLCFTSNVFASSLELNKSVDEFQYAITVEWDQKDKATYDKEVTLFVERISGLLKSKTISREDLLLLVEQRLQNSEATKMMTEAEIIEFISNNSNVLYAQGASWNGTTTLLVAGFSALLITALLYAYVQSIDFDEEKSQYCKRESEPYYQCHSSDLTGYSWCGVHSTCLEWGYR